MSTVRLTSLPEYMRERLERRGREQKDDRQSGEKNVERDFVRRLLPLRPFDETDHAIDERLPRLRGDLDDDAIGEHQRSAGDRRTIAARFADHRRGFTGDRGFVDRSDAFDDRSVAGDDLIRFDDDEIAFAQPRTPTLAPRDARVLPICAPLLRTSTCAARRPALCRVLRRLPPRSWRREPSPRARS